MNFNTMTTDELKKLMPPNENGWEYKDAELLSKGKRSDLVKELGLQTSAFANTGGGYLVFGVKKDDLSFQPCQLLEGGEPMEEFLAKKIQLSVEYPLIGAKVYRISFANDPSQAVFLVEYPNSPKAPHQAKTDKKYYWRANFTSEPAPHFHLELLRNRFTRSSLEISETVFTVRVPSYQEEVDTLFGKSQKTRLEVDLQILVANTSMMCADVWGLHYRIEHRPPMWTNKGTNRTVGSIRSVNSPLLPDESQNITLPLETLIGPNEIPGSHYSIMVKYFELLIVELRTVSHNFVSTPLNFGCEPDPVHRPDLVGEFRRQLSELNIHPDS